MNMNNILMGLMTPQATGNIHNTTKDFVGNKKIDDFNFKDAMENKRYESNKQNSIINEKDRYADKENDIYKEKDQDTTKHMINKSKSILNKDAENKLNETEKIEAVQQYLMQMMAVHLNIPATTIESVMNDLGIDAMDILDQNTFMSLMGVLIGEDQLNLLGDSKILREITALWETIEGVGNELVESGLLTDEQIGLENTRSALTGTSQAGELATEENVMTLNGQIMQSAEDSLTLNVHKGSKEEGLLLNNQQVMEDSVQVGLTLPVQNILESQTVRMWQQTTKEATGLMHTEHAPVNKQILNQVDFISLKDGNELTIDLNPKELGKLSMKVSEHNGIVTTVIRVENERVKEMILQNIEVLKQGLEEQGLAIGSFQVDVGQNAHHKQMEQQKQKASKRIQEIIDKQIEDLEAECLQEEEITISTSREVDIKA